MDYIGSLRCDVKQKAVFAQYAFYFHDTFYILRLALTMSTTLNYQTTLLDEISFCGRVGYVLYRPGRPPDPVPQSDNNCSKRSRLKQQAEGTTISANISAAVTRNEKQGTTQGASTAKSYTTWVDEDEYHFQLQ